MMQTQGPGLREAARQAVAVGESASVGAVPNVTATSPTPVTPVVQPAAAALAGTTTTTGQPPPSAGSPLQGTIQILSGRALARSCRYPNRSPLGKPGVQVAVIAKRPQGYFITHVEGATFPVVNGKQLDAQAHGLNDHDVIELAGKMEFYLKPAA